MPQHAKESESIARIMQGLQCDEATARSIYESDRAIDRGEAQPFDLPKDKEKLAMKFANATTRKKPTNYQFTTRKRKPNATKGEIISAIAEYLPNQELIDIKDVQITNAERQIAFSVGDKKFELTLVQKRS